MGYKVPVGLSNKHLHLSEEHIEILFGKGHKLTPTKDLVQPGQFASEEKVDIVGPKGTLKGIRVLGPAHHQLFKNRFLRFILNKIQVIPLNRGHNDFVAIKRALKVLKDGKVLGIFPEGKRVKEASKIGRAS